MDLVARMFRENPLGAAGGTIFIGFLLVGIFASVIAPHGANDTNIVNRLAPPSLEYPMGTDHVGRDVFSRILIGAQLSMIVGFAAAALATVVSIVLGVLSGYLGGWRDMIIQRMVDAWMTFPGWVLLIVVMYC